MLTDNANARRDAGNSFEATEGSGLAKQIRLVQVQTYDRVYESFDEFSCYDRGSIPSRHTIGPQHQSTLDAALRDTTFTTVSWYRH